MPVQAWKIYNKAKRYIGNGTIPLGTGILKMSLHRPAASTNIKNLAITSFASIGNEISARGVYAANGRAVGSTSKQMGFWTLGASAKQMKLTYTTGGLVFTASGSALNDIMFAAIHFVRSASDATRRVLCYCSLSSGTFTILSPNTITVIPAATGVFTLA